MREREARAAMPDAVTVDGARPGRLEWGIRASFRAYLAALADVEIAMEGVSFDAPSERFIFPLAPGIEPRAHGVLRIRAHGGALDVKLSGLAVREADGGWVLDDATRSPIARLLGTPPSPSGPARVFRDVALTDYGSDLFGGHYTRWTRMDPVVVVRGHRDVPCERRSHAVRHH